MSSPRVRLRLAVRVLWTSNDVDRSVEEGDENVLEKKRESVAPLGTGVPARLRCSGDAHGMALYRNSRGAGICFELDDLVFESVDGDVEEANSCSGSGALRILKSVCSNAAEELVEAGDGEDDEDGCEYQPSRGGVMGRLAPMGRRETVGFSFTPASRE